MICSTHMSKLVQSTNLTITITVIHYSIICTLSFLLFFFNKNVQVEQRCSIVLHLILEKLWNDKESLYVYQLIKHFVNNYPILWKNPLKSLRKEKEKLLLNVIISHFPDELKSLGIDFLTNLYKRPLFNYISLYKYSSLYKLKG